MMKTDRDGPGAAGRSLEVGIPPTGGWKETFLQYAGIPRVELPCLKEGLERGVRVFLWNREDPFFREAHGERIVVITENAFLKTLLNLKGTEKRSHSFQIDGGRFSERSFYIHAPCEILPSLPSGPGACHDAEGRQMENSGITLHERNHILFVSVPWTVLDEQMGSHWEFRPFYSPFIRKHFAETGPAIDFGALRRLFLDVVLFAFRRLDLPLVRMRYPFSGRPSFSFRVDADGFSRQSTDSVLRIAKSLGSVSFSWFIDVQGWGKNIRHVRDLLENHQEVELHCYHHMTYRRENVNRANLKRGVRGLKKYGIRPKGAGSPFGFWFEGYQEAVRELGFEYSSEFAFDCDDLPSFPYNDSRYPVQVPVHTGSIGTFEKAGFSREEMFVHLHGTLDKAIRDCGYAQILDHPLGRIEQYEKEFIDLFKGLLDSGHCCVPVSEYADQARAFLLHRFHPILEDGSIFIEQASPGSARFEIFAPQGTGVRVSSPCAFAFRDSLEQVRDEFAAPPRPEFDEFLKRHDKDQRLTNLTLAQFYRGLTRHRLSLLRRDLGAFLRRGGRCSEDKGQER